LDDNSPEWFDSSLPLNFDSADYLPRRSIMLVLSRKIGEKLVIGDNITVVVSKIAGNRVTLGIEAPGDVRIVRGELELHTKPELASRASLSGNERGSISVASLAK
jgi:carbon storage regulator CsrA